MIIARSDSDFITDINKQRTVLYFRRRSPAQEHLAVRLLTSIDWFTLYSENSTQHAFNFFYDFLSEIVFTVYPMRRVMVTSHDPLYHT